MEPEQSSSSDAQPRDAAWVFLNRDGILRSGWSLALALFLIFALVSVLGTVAHSLLASHGGVRTGLSVPLHMFLAEFVPLLALVLTALLMARFERRTFADVYLRGGARVRHAAQGLLVGFGAVSLLVGLMDAGGWLRMGTAQLGALTLVHYGLLWGLVFLCVGCVEEGAFRGLLQYTLARGVNFWWALGVNAALCLALVLTQSGNGVWGVYAFAALGLLPCLWMRKRAGAGFWLAAWVTSTCFGAVHTGNNGENWIGIFAAALVGFVFCVSVRRTGSLYWAMGCHAAWDWSETFFYGTADSGLQSTGHLFSATPAGNALYSGGADGPEGSLLVLPVVLLLLAAVVLLNRRNSAEAQSMEAPEPIC